MYINADGTCWQEKREAILPVRIVSSQGIENPEYLLNTKPGCVLYRRPDLASVWAGKGSFVVLDFGKEIQGGARIIICKAKEMAHFRLTFGESLTEACSDLGIKNAGNDHSPRDFQIYAGKMSDNTYGSTGFRFLRVELLDEVEVKIQDILAEAVTPVFEREAEIETDDPLINEIIDVAAYTLKLCFQKGYIWDGIKRDRLIWCGDLHPEILTSLYWMGDTVNIKNSLSMLRKFTEPGQWINNIPSYSAWWIICLCDYCRMTGNQAFWEENREYGKTILDMMLASSREDGTVYFAQERNLNYFLDWSTKESPESVTGVAAVFMLACQKWLQVEDDETCRAILTRLSPCLEKDCEMKPVRAFQVLAGRQSQSDLGALEEGGAAGFSTFMAYYILTAMKKGGGRNMVEILKQYYGGMLSRGATTFWEDFDITWLEGSGRIDEFPVDGEKDIHGDFGKHCYQQFRHSLCHGWSSGVLSFIIEHVLGLRITDGGKKVYFAPDAGDLKKIHARFPLKDGWLTLDLNDGKWEIGAPEGVTVCQK